MKKISFLQFILTTIFISTLLISNVITSKQIALPFNFAMTGAIILFPITYILSDIFSEIYGYKWSRITCYTAFTMNLLMVTAFAIALKMPTPAYWQNQEAFEIVLGSTPRVLIASLSAFVLGDFINDIVFQKLKEKHLNDHKGFSSRAILSSFCGEVVDSLIFMPIAFTGLMPLETMFSASIIQIGLKVSYEILILPITNLLVKKISKYEGAVDNEWY